MPKNYSTLRLSPFMVLAIIIGLILSLMPAFAAIDAASYFPLSEGNIWTYGKWEDWGDVPPPPPPFRASVSAVTTSSFTYIGPYTVEVVGVQNIGGVNTYLVDSSEDGTVKALSVEPTGIYVYKINDELKPLPLQLLKFPFKNGSTWFYGDPSTFATKFTVESNNTSVTVQNKTYTNCVRLKLENWGGTGKIGIKHWIRWLAPNVGMVKQESYENTKLTGYTELLSYDVNILDNTPPTKPIVTVDNVNNVVYGSTVRGSWLSTDTETGICEYQAAISTTNTAAGIIGHWQSFGTETSGEISEGALEHGKRYYLLVRAMNCDELWSAIGVSKQFRVEKAADRIEIVPANPTVQAGGKQTFTALIYDEDGLLMAGKKVRWSCDRRYGSITSSGTYTAGKTVGTYEEAVTATLIGQELTATANVTISPGPLQKVAITDTSGNPIVSLNVPIGQTVQLGVKGFDKFNNETPITNLPITWMPVTAKLGSIDANGLFTAGTKVNLSSTISVKVGSRVGRVKVKLISPPV